MNVTALSKQFLTSDQPSGFEPVTPGTLLKVDVLLRGSGAIDTILALQVSDNPKDESSWEDSGLNIVMSGTNETMASDYVFVDKRFYRVAPVTLNAMSVYAVVNEVDTVGHPDRIVMLDEIGFATKSKVFKLPSRQPLTFEVLISGTATVRLYASNLEDRYDGPRWGAPLREFTASSKVIIENEPWVNWMVELTNVNGTVSVGTGA